MLNSYLFLLAVSLEPCYFACWLLFLSKSGTGTIDTDSILAFVVFPVSSFLLYVYKIDFS